MIDQPLHEGETEEFRIMLVGRFYFENIKSLDCTEFDLNTAFSMVFGQHINNNIIA